MLWDEHFPDEMGSCIAANNPPELATQFNCREAQLDSVRYSLFNGSLEAEKIRADLWGLLLIFIVCSPLEASHSWLGFMQLISGRKTHVIRYVFWKRVWVHGWKTVKIDTLSSGGQSGFNQIFSKENKVQTMRYWEKKNAYISQNSIWQSW